MTSDRSHPESDADASGVSRFSALEARLTDLYRSEPPASLSRAVDRWAALAADSAVLSTQPAMLRPRRRTRSWFSAVAAALTVIVVLATVATATGLVDWGRYFQYGSWTGGLAGEDLGTDFNLTQEVDGFTVTIGRVYADAYGVAMVVRVTPPEGLPDGDVDLREATLYDEDGQFLGGPGAQGGGEGDTRVQSFYNNPLPAGTTSVQYRYEITDLRYAVQPVFEDGTVVPLREVVPGVPCQREPPYRGQPAELPIDETRCYLIASQPLVFEFEVPLGPGVSVAPGEQVASDGSVANVTQVSAGRLGASVDIEGVGPFASVSIETGGQTFPLATYGYACPYDATSRFNYITDQEIPLDTDPWTVRISASPEQIPANAGDYAPGAGQCNQFTPEGEWEFTVDPTATTVGGAEP